jgi:MYXO-CTERM domain-containing protein
VGVEVTGGQVQLLSGHEEGWVASTVIECPTGFRYDLVLLDADVPGNSSLMVTVLDATSSPTLPGYANETIPGYVNITRTDVSLTRLNWTAYPSIRIQATLVADGTDVPRMRGWSLYFCTLGEWRDDFLGTGKMEDSRGMIAHTGEAKINPIDGGANWFEDYDAYPPVVFTKGWRTTDFTAIYTDVGGTGYATPTTVASKAVAGVTFADLDNDGDLEMIQAKLEEPNTVIHDHEIWWGDGTGKWSASGCKKLYNEKTARNVAAGDFNGDGWLDLVITDYDSFNDAKRNQVWLNKGDGEFNYRPDISIDSPYNRRMDTGDLNNDGYDDFIVVTNNGAGCYFGGPNGPDGTADIVFSTYVWYSQPRIRDMDQDGYLDILLPTVSREDEDNIGAIYLGGPNGPDTTPDYTFNRTMFYAHDANAGDINGDGYIDIVIVDQGDEGAFIYMGSADGWKYEPSSQIQGRLSAVEIVDVDLDGYDDLVLTNDSKLHVYYGWETLSSTPDITIQFSSTSVFQMAIAVAKCGSPMGSFTTEPITKPDNMRWDILDLDGTLPENTSVSISVLDDRRVPIAGYRRLTDTNIDLSGLAGHGTIRIKVKMTSRSNDTTPVLDRLLVNWMDPMEWREQFYGVAKIAGLEGLDVSSDELRRAQEVGGPGDGHYLSKAFGPEVTREADSIHTLRYTAHLGTSQSGKIRLVDAVTSQVLAETPLRSGTQEWDPLGTFSLKDHPSIQVNVTAEGLDVAGEFALDDIWVNWTSRMNLPPTIIDIWPGEPTVKRTRSVDLYVNVSDDYDDQVDLTVVVQHRLHGSDTWKVDLFDPAVEARCEDGLWVFPIMPRVDAPLGLYTFRANVTDWDGTYSGYIGFPKTLEVLPSLPSAPTNIYATAMDSTVELEWRQPVDIGDSTILGYRIYRGSTNDSLELLFTTGSSAITYLDEDVENGVSYYYALLAYTEEGNGALSKIVEARPAGPPTVPLDLTAEVGDEQVTLAWEAPEKSGGFPLESYYIYKGPTGYQLTWEVNVTGTEFTITGLVNGQTYYFAVSALNQIGEGPMTETLSVSPASLPEAPRDLSATARTERVTLTWKSPSDTGGLDIVEFVIYRGEDPDSLEELREVPRSTSIYNDNGVVGGVTYYYAVAAVTSFGEGPLSEVVSVMPVGPPGEPGDLMAVPGDGQVTLSWSAPENDGGYTVTVYVIMRGTSSDDLTLLSQVLDTLSYLDDEVTNDQTYYYAVAAVNDVGEGLLTDAVEVTPFRPPTVPGRVLTFTGEAKGGKVELAWVAPGDDGGSQLTGYVILRGESTEDMVIVATLGVVTSWTDVDAKRGTTYLYTVAALNEHGQGEPFDGIEIKVTEEEESPGPGLVAAMAALVLAGLVRRRGRRRA